MMVKVCPSCYGEGLIRIEITTENLALTPFDKGAIGKLRTIGCYTCQGNRVVKPVFEENRINERRVRVYAVYKEMYPSPDTHPIAIFRDYDTAKEYKKRILDPVNSAVIRQDIFISDNIWGKE